MTTKFDANESRRVEAIYLTPDVIEQRRAVRHALDLRPGERVVDLGVGPGLLAAEMAQEVGPEGRVCGVDVSDDMLAIAEGRASQPGSAAVELARADLAALPYPAGSFDAAVSTQVLEYVADIDGALAEMHRVLRPGGRVVLLDTDWDSVVWRSTDDERMARILAAFEPHVVDPRLPRTLAGSLQRAGFAVTATRVVPLLNVGFEPATYSGGMMEIIAGFVAGRDGITPDEVHAWAADLRGLDGGYFFSINRYLFGATRSS